MGDITVDDIVSAINEKESAETYLGSIFQVNLNGLLHILLCSNGVSITISELMLCFYVSDNKKLIFNFFYLVLA